MLCSSYCRNFHAHLWPDDITKWKVLTYFIHTHGTCLMHTVVCMSSRCCLGRSTICPDKTIHLALPEIGRSWSGLDGCHLRISFSVLFLSSVLFPPPHTFSFLLLHPLCPTRESRATVANASSSCRRNWLTNASIIEQR